MTTDTTSSRTALVVGGGIGGLTSAIALRRAGWEVTVLERAPALEPVGAGISLWPNAVCALAGLGLEDALNGIAAAADDGAIHTADGTRLGGSPAQELRARHGTPLVVVHRAELQGLLVDALHAAGGTLRTGAEVTDVTVHADGAVVTTDGGREEAGIVVGADGIRSRVRSAMSGGAAVAGPARYTAWRGVADVRTSLAVGEFLGRGELFGIARLTGDRVYWWASARGAVSRDHRGLVERYAPGNGWTPAIAEVIARTPPEAVIETPLRERRPARRMAEGRLVLVGDAAHPMLPNLGQGGCQAIEDAVVLGRALSDGDIAAALSRYDSERRAHTRKVVKASARMARVVHARNPLAVALRDRMLRTAKPEATARRLEPIAAPRRELG